MPEGEVRLRISAQDMASGVVKGFNNTLKNLLATYLSYQGIKMAVQQLSSFVNESMKADVVTAQLSSALQSAGINSERTMIQFDGLASALQNVTMYGDEEVKIVEALLVRFGATTENIEGVTKASLDMAAALGIDSKSAAMAVGKAMQGNLGILQRYGINIDDAVVKSQGFGVVLTELERKFGGAAEAMGGTFQGRLKQIGNLIGDVKEKIGDAIVKNETWRTVLTFIKDKLADFNKWLGENQAKIQEWASMAAVAFINFADFAATSLMDVGTAIAALSKAIIQFITFIAKMDVALGTAFKFEKDIVTAAKEMENALDGVGVSFQTTKIHIERLSEELREKLVPTMGKMVQTITGGGGEGETGLAEGLGMVNIQMRTTIDTSDRLKINFDLLKGGVVELSAEMEEAFAKHQEALRSLGMYVYDNLVEPFFDARRNFGELVKDFMIGMAKMIARMLVFKGLSIALGLATGGTGGFLSQLLFQHGGYVYGGSAGGDSVNARLTQGEYVLNRNAVQQMGRDRLDAINRGGSGMALSPINFSVNINSASPNYDAQGFLQIVRNNLPGMLKDAQRKRQF